MWVSFTSLLFNCKNVTNIHFTGVETLAMRE